MGDHEVPQGCLSIPLPRCIRNLVEVSPVPVYHPSDKDVLDLITGFGRNYCANENEIQQACDLAAGYSDLVVILQRPAPHHDYSVDFEKFVADCPTLDAVDDLIRFATKGKRSIQTVSVFDVYSFKPGLDDERPSDEDCYSLLEKILKAKKPKVVICCWRDVANRCNNPFVRQFIGGGVGLQSIRDKVTIEGLDFVAIRSFHPSTALRYNKYNADYRTLLIYHFIAAFTELSHQIQEPPWIKQINKRSKSSMEYVIIQESAKITNIL